MSTTNGVEMKNYRFPETFLRLVVADIGPRRRRVDHILCYWLTRWQKGKNGVDPVVALSRLRSALSRYRSKCRWRRVSRRPKNTTQRPPTEVTEACHSSLICRGHCCPLPSTPVFQARIGPRSNHHPFTNRRSTVSAASPPMTDWDPPNHHSQSHSLPTRSCWCFRCFR